MDSDPKVRTALLRRGLHADMLPDIEDVGQRVRRRVSRKRLGAGAVGLAAAVAVVGIALTTLSPIGSHPRPTPNPTQRRTGLPEGTLLFGFPPRVLTAVRGVGLEVGVAYSISPDGSKVVGASFQREPTGITRDPELVVVDARTGRATVVLHGGPRDDFGPSAWSPDGAKIAYRKTVYAADPAKVFPRRSTDTVCVLEPSNARNNCFSDLKQVISFDWSPEGAHLLVAGPGKLPLWILDVETGSTSVLLPSGGSPSIRSALDLAGHGVPAQFVEPVWSPSGRYVAALVSVTGGDAAYVPVIFGLDGRFVAMGRPSTESVGVGWSTVDDVLAYTTAKAPYTTTGVYLLDVATGGDRLLVDTTSKTTAEHLYHVTGLAWSPSGRWLAISPSAGRALIIDTTGADTPIELDGGEVEAWAR